MAALLRHAMFTIITRTTTASRWWVSDLGSVALFVAFGLRERVQCHAADTEQ